MEHPSGTAGLAGRKQATPAALALGATPRSRASGEPLPVVTELVGRGGTRTPRASPVAGVGGDATGGSSTPTLLDGSRRAAGSVKGRTPGGDPDSNGGKASEAAQPANGKGGRSSGRRVRTRGGTARSGHVPASSSDADADADAADYGGVLTAVPAQRNKAHTDGPRRTKDVEASERVTFAEMWLDPPIVRGLEDSG